MTDRKRTTEELLKTLRREIFAAEIKVILDKELGRETSPTVKKLAALKLPTITTSRAEEVKLAPTRSRTSKRYVSGKNGGLVAAAHLRAISGKVVSSQQNHLAAP